MNKNITVCTHRDPENIYIEPSPMNDGMYIVYEYEKINWGGGRGIKYIGYTSIQGLADFINW